MQAIEQECCAATTHCAVAGCQATSITGREVDDVISSTHGHKHRRSTVTVRDTAGVEGLRVWQVNSAGGRQRMDGVTWSKTG